MTYPQSELGRVLLVDDELAVRAVVQRALLTLGYDVETAATGEEAIASVAINPGRFRVALLDVTLPGMTVDSIFQRLSTLAPALPVILMSGFHPDVVRELCGSWQPASVLSKPFDVAALEQALLHAGIG